MKQCTFLIVLVGTILRNYVGNKVTDFTYTTESGGRSTLYRTKGDLLLLFFYHIDCDMCKATKVYITDHGIDCKIKILCADPDKNTHLDAPYDLRTTPTLYLLDKDKTVLLKETPIEIINDYLK